MLNAEQHKRRFLARIIPLVYLFLTFTFFSQEPAGYPESNDVTGLAFVDDLHPGGFSEAVLTTDRTVPDLWPAPIKPDQPAGAFSIEITNRFFQHQWKNYRAGSPVISSTPVKRYLLFSCLRLSETPPLA